MVFWVSRPAIAPESGNRSGEMGDRHNISRVKIGDEIINVRLAATEAERNRGLSDTPGLSDNEGMLFIFEKPDFYGFWMKDMLFSIDIVWVSEDLEAVHIEKALSPETFPKIFQPKERALYALEVKSGLTEKLGLELGDKLEFLP